MDEQAGSNVVSVGVDLSEFYMSVEWDILEVPAVRYVHVLLTIYFGDPKWILVSETRFRHAPRFGVYSCQSPVLKSFRSFLP